jgi:hypothetical protein
MKNKEQEKDKMKGQPQKGHEKEEHPVVPKLSYSGPLPRSL